MCQSGHHEVARVQVVVLVVVDQVAGVQVVVRVVVDQFVVAQVLVVDLVEVLSVVLKEED